MLPVGQMKSEMDVILNNMLHWNWVKSIVFKYKNTTNWNWAGPWINLRDSSLKNENVLNIYSPSGHLRCRLVWVFLKTQIWRNLALHQLLTNGSSAVNGCRQNENVLWSEKLHVCKKQKTNPSLRRFELQTVASNFQSSAFLQERNMHRIFKPLHAKQSKTVICHYITTVINKYFSGFWCERMDGLFQWRKFYYGLWTGI